MSWVRLRNKNHLRAAGDTAGNSGAELRSSRQCERRSALQHECEVPDPAELAQARQGTEPAG